MARAGLGSDNESCFWPPDHFLQPCVYRRDEQGGEGKEENLMKKIEKVRTLMLVIFLVTVRRLLLPAMVPLVDASRGMRKEAHEQNTQRALL